MTQLESCTFPEASSDIKEASPAARMVFARLAGDWALDRTMQPGGRFRGEAIVRPAGPDLLLYQEAGTTTLDNGAQLRSFQSYQFRLVGNAIQVLFDETPPRLFHVLNIEPAGGHGLGAAHSHHRCGADDYNSSYEFDADGVTRIVHRVFGPRKNYVSETSFKRTLAVERAS